jgi:hypothetical protein
LIWQFSWSKTKNLNTVVETKMSGVEILKMFESDLSDMHYGHLESYFKVEKLNRGSLKKLKKTESVRGGATGRVTGTAPIFLFGLRNCWIASLNTFEWHCNFHTCP